MLLDNRQLFKTHEVDVRLFERKRKATQEILVLVLCGMKALEAQCLNVTHPSPGGVAVRVVHDERGVRRRRNLLAVLDKAQEVRYDRRVLC